jgi:hypothetical protein
LRDKNAKCQQGAARQGFSYSDAGACGDGRSKDFQSSILAIPAILAIQGVGCNKILKIISNREEARPMPKLNARENTRNRSQAAKRERNRTLRASLNMPAGAVGKHPAKAADNARTAANKAGKTAKVAK